MNTLKFADSPRLEGESLEHIRVLAGVEAELPPILVHRASMRVIDGMHRLRAAILKGKREISVEFFEGQKEDAFVAAVTANTGHGMPLSLADREAAVVRILETHPQWSDRVIADAVGLASTTVARIRSRSTDKDAWPEARVGKDGRVRPINGAAGRRLAGKLYAERPDASLREIAELAGISPTTAKDVRDRVRRGEDPVPPRQILAERKRRISEPSRGNPRPTRVQELPQKARVPGERRSPDPDLVVQKLQRDPSLRLSENGRGLLRLLSARSLNSEEWRGVESWIPAHCIPLVADLAASCADEWTRFAEALKDRARTEGA